MPFKSEFKCGCFKWVLRAHNTLSPHLVSTLCLFTLRLHTLSLRFVESPDTEVRCLEFGLSRWADFDEMLRFQAIWKIPLRG